MCCAAGLAPLNSAFSAPREGTLRPMRSTRTRCSGRSSGVPQCRPFGRCCLAGGPSAGSGSTESGCNEMRRPLGEQIPFAPAGERHEDQVRAQPFPQRVTGSGLR